VFDGRSSVELQYEAIWTFHMITTRSEKVKTHLDISS